jgi:hypothetical protein
MTQTVPVEPAPRHATRSFRGARRIAAWVGALSTVIGVAIGAVALSRTTGPGSPTTAHQITTTTSDPLPLSDNELLRLLEAPADLGTLADPGRRASCLAGLGYRAGSAVLGARQLRIHGQAAVVLLLADDDPHTVAALAVRPGCSAADTGLLAETTLPRP